MQEFVHFYYDEFKRFSPLLLLIYSLFFVKKGIHKNLLLTGYIFNTVINFLLKNIIFYPLMKNNYYPIIGYGTRPKNAINCDLWSTNKLSTSYGMPSGHAQLITFFLIAELFKSNNILAYPTTTLFTPKNVIWIFISIVLLYSRVELGCHTYQQVIIGILFGILSYFVSKKIVKMF